jgi:WD40 repeat protein
MTAERNALQQHVFPHLRELCAASGASFQAVDLRWGVSADAAQNQQTMPICLGEIDRCMEATERPNFILLLGDRRGWCPLPQEIPASEFVKIHRFAASNRARAGDVEGLDRWYRCDRNASPPIYRLVGLDEEHETVECWQDEESHLRVFLRDAARAVRFSPTERLKYTASATEQEIARRGVLDRAPDRGVFCFFRTIDDLPHDLRAKDYRDFDAQGRPDAHARVRVTALKERLRRHLGGDAVRDYTAAWREDAPSTDHIAALCDDAFHRLSAVILDEVSRMVAIDDLSAQIQAHHAFGEGRRRFFVGRRDALAAVERYRQAAARHPFVVYGPPGSGKSTLMAQIADPRDAGMICLFIGAVPGSRNLRTLLDGICRHLRRRFGDDEHGVPSQYERLVRDLHELLGKATAEQPVTLLLDGLDQLSESDGARSLAWLPVELSGHAHVVVSASPGDALDALENRIPESHRCPLAAMSREEGGALLTLWLDDARRTLDDPIQRATVLEGFEKAEGSPLYLRLAFEEARLWHSDTSVGKLSDSVEGLVQQLLARLSEESNHGHVLVSRSLSYLMAGKDGLGHEELLDLLSLDRDVMNDFRARYQLSPRADTLPVIVWSRFYWDLAPYLTERRTGGVVTLDVFHRQFGDVVRDQYLAIQGNRPHRALAAYFGAQPNTRNSGGRDTFNLRKLSEWPFQLAHGELWEELNRTLLDFEFLQAKVAAVGPALVIEDFALTELPGTSTRMSEAVGDTTHLNLVVGALRLSVHALVRDASEFQGQVYGRLLGSGAPPVRALVVQARGWRSQPWLRTLSPSLTQAGGPERFTLEGHTSSVRAVAVTPDGRLAITGSMDCTLKSWDLTTGREIRTLEGHREMINSVAVTRDGRLAVSGAYDSARIWDVETGHVKYTLKDRTDAVEAVAVDAEGRLALTATYQSETVTVWDATTGKALRTLKGHSANVRDLAVSADGRVAVSASNDHTLRVWNLRTGRTRRTLKGHKDAVSRVAMTPDGRLAVSASDNAINVWDLATGVVTHNFESGSSRNADYIHGVGVSDDGRIAHAITNHGVLTVFDLVKGNVRSTLNWRTLEIEDLDVSGDGLVAVAASMDGSLKVWDLSSTAPHEAAPNDRANAVAVSDDGRVAACASGDKTVKVWELQEGTNGPELTGPRRLEGHTDAVVGVVLSRDGRTAISASYMYEGTLKVWDVAGARATRSFPMRVSVVEGLSVTPDGRQAFTALYQGMIQVWDIEKEQSLCTLFGHQDEAMGVAVSDDGRRAVSASADGTIKVWDIPRALRDGSISRTPAVATLRGHHGKVFAVAMTGDGRMAVSSSEDRTVKVWDLSSIALSDSTTAAKTLTGHRDSVVDVDLNDDATVAVSASVDGTLKIWDLRTGTAMTSLSVEGPLSCCVISPDARIVVAGERYGRVHFMTLEVRAS